jgi:hypothetical protein
MNKNFKGVTLLLYLLGFLIFSLSIIFRARLTDFELGFCEGISIVFIVAGFIYMCWCIFKGKNPYKIENSDK